MKITNLKKLLFFTILSFLSFSYSTTEVEEGEVFGIWSFENSPYHINGNLTIPDDSTLTIEPGCYLEFQGHYRIDVQGTILAVGTATDTITFTVNDTTGFSNLNTTNGGWHGLKFDNGSDEGGMNGAMDDNDSSKVIYCKLEHGKAVGDSVYDKYGGAIYIDAFSNLIIKNSTFFSNICEGNGGAISCECDLFEEPYTGSSPIIDSNLFQNNKAKGDEEPHFGKGGAICVNNIYNACYISNNSFSNNFSKSLGGGCFITGFRSENQIYNNFFSGNNSEKYGGALALWALLSGSIVSNNIFKHNTAKEGGALYLIDTAILFDNNLISNNESINSFRRGGGGIYNDGDNFSGPNIFTNNIIINNYSNGSLTSHNGGAGLYFVNAYGFGEYGDSTYTGNEPIFINNIIVNNTTTGGGGGLYLRFSNAKLCNNLICNNESSKGGGLYTEEFAGKFYNNIITGNVATSEGSQFYFDDNVYNHRGIFLNYNNFDHNNNEDNYDTEYSNNIDQLPNFVSPTSGAGIEYDASIANWYLNPISPNINAGVPDTTGLNLNLPLTDFANNPRFSGIIDIGPYEYFSLQSEFEGDTLTGYKPFNVNFTDKSTGNPLEWFWDFDNDEIIDSEVQNPDWIFSERGLYDISLQVRDHSDSSFVIKNSYINVINAAPTLLDTIPDINIEENTSFDSLYLNSIFYDRDGDILEYSFMGNEHIDVTISESGQVTFSPESNWSGVEEIIFTADDGYVDKNRKNINAKRSKGATVSDTVLVQVGDVNIDDLNNPKITELFQNYPNPFNPSTTIKYNLADESNVKITIYNAKGEIVRKLVDKKQIQGRYEITWDGNDRKNQTVSTGLYFYQLETDNFHNVRKAMMIK